MESNNKQEKIAQENTKEVGTIRDLVKMGFPEHFIREGLRQNMIPHFKIGNKYYINIPLYLKIVNKYCYVRLDSKAKKMLDYKMEPTGGGFYRQFTPNTNCVSNMENKKQ